MMWKVNSSKVTKKSCFTSLFVKLLTNLKKNLDHDCMVFLLAYCDQVERHGLKNALSRNTKKIADAIIYSTSLEFSMKYVVELISIGLLALKFEISVQKYISTFLYFNKSII